jgi:hypothetical protein
MGWGCSSVTEHLPDIHKALASLPSMTQNYKNWKISFPILKKMERLIMLSLHSYRAKISQGWQQLT